MRKLNEFLHRYWLRCVEGFWFFQSVQPLVYQLIPEGPQLVLAKQSSCAAGLQAEWMYGERSQLAELSRVTRKLWHVCAEVVSTVKEWALCVADGGAENGSWLTKQPSLRTKAAETRGNERVAESFQSTTTEGAEEIKSGVTGTQLSLGLALTLSPKRSTMHASSRR